MRSIGLAAMLLPRCLLPACLLLAGIAGGAAFAAGAAVSLPLGVGLGAGLALLPLLPRGIGPGVQWCVPGLMALLVALEEFPSGLGETGAEGVERSTRTAFYAKSVGVGGLYPPDLLLGLCLALLLLSALLHRRRRVLQADGIGWALACMMGMLAFSALLSFAEGDPLAPVQLDDPALELYKFNDRAIAMIGLFQFKNFALLPAAYIVGLLYLDRRSRIGRLLAGCLAGMVVLLASGLVRAGLHPGILRHANPLFYDSPSSWLFALLAFQTVLGWAFGLYGGRTLAWLGGLSALAFACILASYRRTMWGGIAISGAAVFLVLPRRAQIRLLVVGFAAALLGATALLLTPAGALLLSNVAGRVGETTIQDLSTLYRVALFVHFLHEGDDTPLFGHGLEPLWNNTISFGYLRFNLENIHSLYFWIWLRSGLAGFSVAMLAFLYMLGRAGWLYATLRDPEYRAISMLILTMLFIYLFSGIFNPVYGEARYMIPLGIALALLTRIGQLARLEAVLAAANGAAAA